MTRSSGTGCSRPGFGLNLLMPTITSCPESMRACLRAAASSIRCLGMPDVTASAMPPSASTSAMISDAPSTSCCVRLSIMYEPAHGSTVMPRPDSCARMSWVLRASEAEKSVGSPMASSNELVCSDWVPPITAAIASTVVRMMLLYGSCAVSDHPDV